MNEQPRRLGWAGWLVVYVAAILLPLRFGFDIVRNLSEERLARHREDRLAWLERTGRSLFEQFGPEHVFGRYFAEVVTSGSPTVAIYRELHDRFPGAFRIHVFNRLGEPLAVPPEFRFPPSEAFLQFSRAFLPKGPAALAYFQNAVGIDPSGPEACSVPDFLGPGLSHQEILTGTGRIILGERHRKPVAVWWRLFVEKDSPPMSRLSRSEPVGIYVEFDIIRIPRSFYVELALRGYSDRIPPSVRTLALVDAASPRRSTIQPEVPRDPVFLERLIRAATVRSRSIFPFGPWYVLACPVAIESPKVLYLLTNLTPAIDEERMFLGQARFGFVVLAGLGAWGLFLLRKGLASHLSLKWDVLALLSFAMVLPLGGSYWAGTGVNRGRENRDRAMMSETLKGASENLHRRYQDFVEEYGIRLNRHVRRFAARFPSETAFVAALASQCQRIKEADNPFTEVFVGDSQGKPILSTLIQRRQEGKGYQIILGLLARRHFGAGERSEALLGKVLIEDAGQFTGSEGDSFSLPPLGILSQIKFGRSQTAVLPLVYRGWQRPLILLFQVSNRRLMRVFLEQEWRSGSLAALRRSSQELLGFAFLCSDERFPALPRKTRGRADMEREIDLVAKEVGSLYGVQGEVTGTIHREEGNFTYYVSPDESFLQYRLLGVFGDRKIQQMARRRERLFRLGFVGVLSLALLMGFLLSRRMLGPVAMLDQGLERIRSGDLQSALPDLGRDEIGVLGLNVNHLVKELRERERMQAYLSETVLEAIRHPPSEGELDARNREVTILISDIRGFTTLSECHSPAEMFGMLNEYFESVEPLLRRFGGQVQKFIGDAVYAVFPEEGRTGALGAVQAAREMVAFLTEFNRRRLAGNRFPIEIGIGISTGRVLLGKLGSEARMDYAYVGLEVDEATRLESASKAGRHTRIILSSHTRDLVFDLVQTEKIILPGEDEAFGYEIMGG